MVGRNPRTRKGAAYSILLVSALLLGVLLNFGWLLRLEDRAYWSDEEWYVEYAQSLRKGEPYEWALMRAPGSVYVLAGWMWCGDVWFGSSPWLFWRLSNVVLGLLSAGLSFLIARQLYESRRVAGLAAVLCLVYPFFVYQRGFLLSENLTIAGLLLTTLALLRAQISGSLLAYTAAGLLAGLTCFVRPVLLLLPLAVAAAQRWSEGLPWRSVLLRSGAFALAIGAVLSLWLARNYRISGTLQLTSMSSAELYKGVATPPGEPISVSRTPAAEAGEERPTWWSFVRENPGTALVHKLYYAARFWSPTLDNVERQSRGTLLAVASWLILIPLYGFALAGFWKIPHQGRALLLFLILGYWFFHVVTVVKFRYRIPVDALLLVFAAGGCARLFTRWKAGRGFSSVTPSVKGIPLP